MERLKRRTGVALAVAAVGAALSVPFLVRTIITEKAPVIEEANTPAASPTDEALDGADGDGEIGFKEIAPQTNIVPTVADAAFLNIGHTRDFRFCWKASAQATRFKVRYTKQFRTPASYSGYLDLTPAKALCRPLPDDPTRVECCPQKIKYYKGWMAVTAYQPDAMGKMVWTPLTYEKERWECPGPPPSLVGCVMKPEGTP